MSNTPPEHEATDRYADDPDTALAERCLRHDKAAWDAFVDRFSRLIYSVVYDCLKRHGVDADPDRVDDLFHMVFAALYDNDYKKLRQWSRRCSLASWIRLVASSTVIDRLRKRRSVVPLDVEADGDRSAPPVLVDPGESPLRLMQRIDQIAAVRAALDDLSASDQHLLRRLYVDEARAEEVAEELDIRVGALYTRKNRALNRLKRALEPIIDTL